MYLYIFDDGVMRQTDQEPTATDIECIENGSLEVVRFRADNYCRYDNGRWVEIDSANQDSAGDASWHIP